MQSVLERRCQTFHKYSTQDLISACEHNLAASLSGKIQAVFTVTEVDEAPERIRVKKKPANL